MEESPKYIQIKDISDIIGKKVFLDRAMSELELEIWEEEIAKGEDNSYLKKLFEDKKERKKGMFRRSMLIGKLDFIELIYNITEELYSLYPKLMDRIDFTKPVLNCYFGIDSSNIEIKKLESTPPVLEIVTLYGVPVEFICDADPQFEEYAKELESAGFKIE